MDQESKNTNFSFRKFSQEERERKTGPKEGKYCRLDLKPLRNILCHPKSITKIGKRARSSNP